MAIVNDFVKKNLSIAWPLAMNALLMQSMHMIDTFMVSSLGEVSLGAMGIAVTIIAFLMGIQMALANGTQLVISRAVGSGSSEAVTRSFIAGLCINLLCGMVFFLVLVSFQTRIIGIFTQEPLLFSEVERYLSVAQYIVIVSTFGVVTTALFNGLGRTRVPLYSFLLELPINAAISYYLIYGVGSFAGIGVIGAAIGSLVGVSVRCVYLATKLRNIELFDISTFKVDASLPQNMKLHFYEIFPVAANVTILSIGATVYQMLYSQLIIHAYAAIILMMPWIRAGSQFLAAWAQASAITISQAIGSRELTDLRGKVNSSIHVAILASLASAVLFYVISLLVDHIYQDLDPQTYAALSVIAPLYILLPIFRGYNNVQGKVLRALGKTTEVFKINFVGQWVISLPLCAVIVFYFDQPLFWAFAMTPLEEIIKSVPFGFLSRRALNEFDHQEAEKLMYS